METTKNMQPTMKSQELAIASEIPLLSLDAIWADVAVRKGGGGSNRIWRTIAGGDGLIDA